MTPIEIAIVETLQRSGPCCLDDVVTSLPNSSWGEVFAAVDRMSRDGRCCFINEATRPTKFHSALNLPIQRLAELERSLGI